MADGNCAESLLMSKLPVTAGCALTLLITSCSQQVREKSPEQIWRETSESIVFVTARGINGNVAQGSGFFATLDGKRVILTNRHVVQGADEVSIAPQGKNEKRARAYKISPDLDLAVIECPDDLTIRPLPLSKRAVQPGAEVFALGFPLGIANVISRGMIGAVEHAYFLFDASISSGNSGGPIVDKMGEVIGVATMGSRAGEGVVVQNLNVGIRAGAIPQLALFADPLLRIAEVSDRIREVERFIEQGFLREGFFALHKVLQHEWMFETLKAEKPEEWAEVMNSEEGRSALLELAQERKRIEEKHGSAADGIVNWIAFLKECERRVAELPGVFAGLGNDPVLAQFLKDERRGGRVFPVIRVNATPELLPKLAGIGADHWLAQLEDLRYRLEYIAKHERIPTMGELEAREKIVGRERPSIRLKFSLSGDREVDLRQFMQTLAKWSNRKEVFEDSAASLTQGPSPQTDPVSDEIWHGKLLQQVSELWDHQALAAGQRGELDEALTLFRRGLRARSASSGTGRLLAQHLVFAGRIEDAWTAYRAHFSGEPPFDAFELSDGWSLFGTVSPAHVHISDGMNEEGEAFKKQFGRFPTVIAHVREWNAAVKTVAGRRLAELPSFRETLASEWYRRLDDFEKLRVLLYYRHVRSTEQDDVHFERTGKFPKHDPVQEEADFDAALKDSPTASRVWTKAFEHRAIGFPL